AARCAEDASFASPTRASATRATPDPGPTRARPRPWRTRTDRGTVARGRPSSSRTPQPRTPRMRPWDVADAGAPRTCESARARPQPAHGERGGARGVVDLVLHPPPVERHPDRPRHEGDRHPPGGWVTSERSVQGAQEHRVEREEGHRRLGRLAVEEVSVDG